jgi:hypothetical protein
MSPEFDFYTSQPKEPGLVVRSCDPSTQKAKAGGWQVQDQPGLHGLHSETLTQK